MRMGESSDTPFPPETRGLPPPLASSPLDLFGNPNPLYQAPEADGAAPTPTPVRSRAEDETVRPGDRGADPDDRRMPAGLSEKSIASFSAARIEARFEIPSLGAHT